MVCIYMEVDIYVKRKKNWIHITIKLLSIYMSLGEKVKGNFSTFAINL